jgi:LPS export ABC transporter protein LptC
MLLLCAALSSCSSSKSGPPEETQQTLRGLTMVESASGQRRWDLKADSANLREAEEVIDLDKPVVNVQEKGRDITHMKAETGRYHTDSRDMELHGKVKVESLKDGATLFTELLHFDADGGKVWTDDPVKIVRADGAVDGVGLTAKPDLSEFTIKHQKAVMRRTLQ